MRAQALHADYQYMLWTDTALRELIADEYPWLLATYDAYPHGAGRSSNPGLADERRLCCSHVRAAV